MNEKHKRSIEIATKSGILLQLHTDSICTACQYLHRFYQYLMDNPPDGDDTEYDIGVIVATSLYIGLYIYFLIVF